MKVALLLAVLLVPSPLEIAVLAQLPASDVTDADVERLFAGVDQARGYNDLVTILTRHERALVSQRLLDSIDRQLRNASLNENQRGGLLLARQTALDGRERGPRGAAQLLAVRMIAGAALAADTPQQFAATLTTFSEFAPVISAALVRAALDTPGNSWPKPLFPLMEQLAADWPRLGRRPPPRVWPRWRIARRVPRNRARRRGARPIRHWSDTGELRGSCSRVRVTTISCFASMERPNVGAPPHRVRARRRWAGGPSPARVLSLTWAGEAQTSQAFTMYQGQLVLPNVQSRRVFWDRLDR